MCLFRGTHLEHHRWLNSDGDPARASAERVEKLPSWRRRLVSLELVQHVGYLTELARGKHPLVKRVDVALAFVLSVAHMFVWIAVGRADVALLGVLVVAFTTLVPVSLRGAIEHHGPSDCTRSANEYRVLIPLLRLNRHVHHHEAPSVPWYRLEWRTPQPLPWHAYFTHWYRVYVSREYVQLDPPSRRESLTGTARERRVPSPLRGGEDVVQRI